MYYLGTWTLRVTSSSECRGFLSRGQGIFEERGIFFLIFVWACSPRAIGVYRAWGSGFRGLGGSILVWMRRWLKVGSRFYKRASNTLEIKKPLTRAEISGVSHL